MKAIIPVIFATFKSNPYPASQTKCLNSFKMWKLKVQHREITINFPKLVLKKVFTTE